MPPDQSKRDGKESTHFRLDKLPVDYQWLFLHSWHLISSLLRYEFLVTSARGVPHLRHLSHTYIVFPSTSTNAKMVYQCADIETWMYGDLVCDCQPFILPCT